MSNTDLTVFIENLKETTTVLQQLTLCINEIKNCISNIKKIYVHNIYININDTSAEDTREGKFMIVIINNDNTEFTTNTLKNYLINNTNYENNKLLKTNGCINYDGSSGYIYSIGYNVTNTNFNFNVMWSQGESTGYGTILNSNFENGLTINDNVKEVQ